MRKLVSGLAGFLLLSVGLYPVHCTSDDNEAAHVAQPRPVGTVAQLR
jgi:hypothetical protein